jgi:hypothetical protein
LVWSSGAGLGYPAARPCNLANKALKQAGWSLKAVDGNLSSVVAPGGGCLMRQGAGYAGGAGGLIIAACNASSPAQTFVYDAASKQLATASGRKLCVDVHSGVPIVWMYVR